MRLIALGALLGTSWIQVQRQLPDTWFYLGVGLLCGVLSTVCAWVCRDKDAPHASAIKAGLALMAAAGLACSWTIFTAQRALDDRLSESFDRESLWLDVVVRDLPTLQERGWRFEVDVRSARRSAEDADRLVNFPDRGLMFWPKSESGLWPQTLAPGERWRLQARVRQPVGTLNPEAFDLEAWMLERGLQFTASVQQGRAHRVPQRVGIDSGLAIDLDRTRDWIRQRITQALGSSPEAGVISALVVGDQRAITNPDWAIFRKTGVSHLMSISGLHVTMFAALAAWIGSWAWRLLCRWPFSFGLWVPVQSVGAAFAIAGAMGYALLAGFAIPAQRTALMVLVVGCAKILGMRADPWSVMAIALLAVLMTHPMAVLAPGFWLSFIAVAFLFSLADLSVPAAPVGQMKRMIDAVRQAALAQWAITLGLLPITILMFQQVSIVGPLANAIAIPVVSFVVTPLSMAGVMEQALLDTHALLGLAAWTQERLQMLLVWLAGQTFSTFDWPSPGWLRASIASAGMVMVFGNVLPGTWRRWRHFGWFGLVALFGVAPPAPQEGEMQVTLMDVGQGSGVLIRTREHALLYDTGPVMGQGDAGERIVLPTLRRYGVRGLDAIVVSHADQDHSGGLASVISSVSVRQLIAPELDALAPMIQQSAQAAPKDPSIEQVPCRAGLSWVWNGVSFQVLHPAVPADGPVAPRHRNRHSCLLRIADAHGGSILLTGDIPVRTDRELVGRFVGLQDPQDDSAAHLTGVALASQVLMAPHHGAKTSLSDELLRAVAPSLVGIQAGYRNRFGHPHPDVLERMRLAGITADRTLRTDLQGAIEIRWVVGQPMFWDFWRDHRRYWHLPRGISEAQDETDP